MLSSQKGWIVLLLVVVALMLGGCRTATIHNVKDAPVHANQGQITQQQVGDAIVRAGADLGWQMRREGNGHIVGILSIRDHRAEVDITYDQRSYDISYRDSRNLRHDGENIHKNYNSWVSNLDNRIQSRLLAL